MEKVANFKYIVYETVNKVNGKIYVGVHKTKDPEIFDGYIGCGVRITSPSSYNKPKTAFQYAVRKYGTKNFVRTTLKIFDNEEDAMKLEEEIVDRDFINRNDTYNMALGGGGGGGNAPCIKVYQFNEEGELLKEWPSITDAAEFYGVSCTAIRHSYEDLQSCKGYYWSLTDNIDASKYSKINKGQLCYQYNNKGKLIATHATIHKAAQTTGMPKHHIQRAINGGYQVQGCYFDVKLHEEYTGKRKVSLKKKTLYVYDLNGKFLTELKDGDEICKYFDLKSTWPITSSIRQNRPYKQWQFSVEKLESMKPVINKRNISKAIICYDNLGNYVEEFDSITKAVEKYGTGVYRVLKGTQRFAKGFTFRYKEVNDIV